MVGRTNWNGGVLALHADSPAWDIWAREYQTVINRSGEWFGGAQSAFTYLDMIGALKIHSLPAIYNWMVAYAPPHWDNETRQFVSPVAPHEKILLMHQNHKSKSRKFRVRFTSGGSRVTTFRYPDYLALCEETPSKPPWWRGPWASPGGNNS